MTNPLSALVLAEDEGKRFRSEGVDICRSLLGKSMLRLTIDAVLGLKPLRTCVALAGSRPGVREDASAPGVEFAPRNESPASSGLVRAVRDFIRRGNGGDVLVMPADLPLVRTSALRSLLAFHRKAGAPATAMGARICVFDARELARVLFRLPRRGPDGDSGLSEISRALRAAGSRARVFPIRCASDLFRVRSRRDLLRAADALRERRISELLGKGVAVLDPRSTWIGPDVEIGRGTVVYPSVVLEGRTVVGRRCLICPGVHIANSRVGNRVKVFSATVMDEAVLENDVTVGPFARLRPRTILRRGSHVGNFVEMKNTDFGRGSKAGHLSYLGDSEIRDNVNIGAGTITCNYDGSKKNRTTIESGAFIGSGTELIAPVRIGRGAYVAAGSVITKDVSAGALAVARGKQVERAGWARKRKARRESRIPEKG